MLASYPSKAGLAANAQLAQPGTTSMLTLPAGHIGVLMQLLEVWLWCVPDELMYQCDRHLIPVPHKRGKCEPVYTPPRLIEVKYWMAMGPARKSVLSSAAIPMNTTCIVGALPKIQRLPAEILQQQVWHVLLLVLPAHQPRIHWVGS